MEADQMRKQNNCLKKMGLFAVVLCIGGCQSGWHYEWGSYEPCVKDMYSNSNESAAVGEQIQTLAKEIHKTEANAKAGEPSRVPPGKYAHLGYLYAMQGDKINARSCFESDKRLYPESTVFIDGMLGRLR